MMFMSGADGKNRRYFETTSVGGRSGESTMSLYQHSTLLLEIVDGSEKKLVESAKLLVFPLSDV